MSTSFVSRTCKHFETITDPRVNRGDNHPLLEMVFLTLCATICDANSWVDVERYGKAKLEWLRRFFPFSAGIPSHDTLGRVFSRLDSIQFHAALQSWVNDITDSLQDQTVAVDGKTLRGSFDAASGKSALHSVSAWACGLRMCIGLNSVDDKSNEIPAVQQLIDMLDLQGATITADAMHCQKETAKAIRNKDADYILFVKGNQPSLQAELRQAITDALDDDDKSVRKYSKSEKNRNRDETREVVILPCPQTPVFAEWKDAKTIGIIFRTREINGKLQEESEAFISSRPCKVRDLSKRIREHWGIENSQHHVLDVTFAEDSSRIRKGNGPEISAAFRRLALNILQRDTTIKDNVRGKRKRCGWDNSAIEKLMANFSRV